MGVNKVLELHRMVVEGETFQEGKGRSLSRRRSGTGTGEWKFKLPAGGWCGELHIHGMCVLERRRGCFNYPEPKVSRTEEEETDISDQCIGVCLA